MEYAGIQGIDTRALTRTLRIKGHKRGVLRRAPASVAAGIDRFTWIRGQAPAATAWADEQVQAAKCVLPYSEQRYVAEVTTPDRQVAGPVRWAPWPTPQQRANSPRIALTGRRRQDQHRALSRQPRLPCGCAALRGQRARSGGD